MSDPIRNPINLVACVILAAFLQWSPAQYIPKSQGLTDPNSAIAFVTESADFWIPSHDTERGGFYTDVNREGNPTKTRKTILTQSRHAFGFAKAFMLTGDEMYLDLARSALDFMYAHYWDETNGGWFVEVNEDGTLTDSSWNRRKWAFFQDYALLGPASVYQAAHQPVDREWLDRGSEANEKRWDDREGLEGYFENAESDYTNLRGKGFLPTVDALNTYVIRRYQISESADDLSRAFLLGDHIVDYLVASMDDEAALWGFPELYDGDWAIDFASTRVNTGHVLKTAWMLAQLHLTSPRDAYVDGIQRLIDEVWTYDLEGHESWDIARGAPFANFNWQTGERDNSNREWWMLEQAFTAGILAHFITGNETYLKMADESLAFFENHFVDAEFGEVYAITDEEGVPTSTNKGDFWKAGFHSTELGWFTYLYGKLFYRGETVTLHFRMDASEMAQDYVLNPLPIEDSRLGIVEVQHGGEAYDSFDPVARKLELPPGVGGVFAVTFELDPETAVPVPITWETPEAVAYGDRLTFEQLNPVIGNTEMPLVVGEDVHLSIQLGDDELWDSSKSDEITFVPAPAGTHALKVTTALTEAGLAKGFTDNSLEISLEITPRRISISPTKQSMIFGSALPANETYEILYEGLPVDTLSEADFLTMNIDASGVLFETTATSSSDVGIYEVAISGVTGTANVMLDFMVGELEITPAAATFTLTGLSQVADGDPKLPSIATNPEGLAYQVQFETAESPTLPGSYPFTVTLDNPNYEGTATGTLVLERGRQTITFVELSDQVIDRAAIEIILLARSDSDLPVTFELREGEADLEGGTLTLTQPGELEVAAVQPGNTFWHPAVEVVHRFRVTGRGVIRDQDEDGLPDEFEMTFFGDPVLANPNEDADRDGQSNLAEHLFGTHPVDGQSIVRPLLRNLPEDGAIVVEFDSVIDRIYQLEASSDLKEFSTLGEPIEGNGERIAFPEMMLGDEAFQAFRIRAQAR